MTPSVPEPSLRAKIWRKLTEPHARITGAEDRRQTRMLAALIMMMLPLMVLALFGRICMGELRFNLLLPITGLIITYGITRTRFWKYAAPLTVIAVWLLPVGAVLLPPSSPFTLGLMLILWYFLCIILIYVLYGLRLAYLAAVLAYFASLSMSGWFVPFEATYFAFVTIWTVGIFLVLGTFAYLSTENERERLKTLVEVNEARRLAEALTETTAILSSTLDLEEVLDRILQQVAGIVPSSASDIMLIEDGVARIVRLRGYLERGIERQILDMRLRVDDVPNFRRMRETGEPLLIANTQDFPEWVDIPVSRWIRSELGAPIRLEGETIGFLNVCDENPNVFTPTQARYLAVFAVQAAIAIRNARLFDAARRSVTDLEKEVNERTDQLNLTHSRLRAILDSTGEGIFYTEGGYIQYANAAVTELTGYAQDELIGKTLDNLRDPILDASELQQIRAVPLMIWKHGVWRGEARLRRKDGTVFYAGLTISPMGSREQAALRSVTLLRDISGEKELALQKSHFVAHASHELRTPITNLKTRLYLLRKRPESLPEHLPVLEDVAERMKRLVEDLLERTRLERGLITVRLETLCLQVLLRRVVELQRPEAESKQLAILLDLPVPPIMIHVDGERLIQVFTNLLTNAISYTASGGSITISACIDGERVRIDFLDTGVGIAAEHLPHIFEPFYRVMSDVQGTGLGLSLARQILVLHGGEISVRSQPGSGSCFSVYLRVVEASLSASVAGRD